MTSAMHTVHVSVRHTTPLIACGLLAVVASRPGLTIVSDGADVIVADLSEALRLVGHGDARAPGRRPAPPRVLVVASADHEHVVRQAFECGVFGYLMLGCDVEELDHAIRMVAGGGRYACPSAARHIAQSFTREPLTPRENDVLRILMRGASNKEIARELQIALGTVKAHVKAIMDKLEARCRTEVVSIANERGLVDDRLPPEAAPRWPPARQAMAIGFCA